MQSKALIKNIMLVDDNKLNQRLMESSLKRFGFQIDVANNGQEAVDMYKANPESYDLIIMDIMMPVMDGFEATRHIRIFEQKVPNRVPIIALTANTFDADREKCLSHGMDEYIAKPLDMKKLTWAFHVLGLTEK